jgi:phosphoglycolate phosphatase-like HAD superfamily hydrolase
LLDSLPIKNKVFIDVLSSEGIPIKFSTPIIQETIALTRSYRFKKIWKEFHKEEIPMAILERLLLKSAEKLSNCFFPPIAGANDFIKQMAQSYQFHIVTAAEESEVVRNFKKLGWNKLLTSATFKVSQKNLVFKNLVDQHNIPVEQYLAIGDTESDCLAALENKVDFWIISKSTDLTMPVVKLSSGISKDFYPVIQYLS